MKPTMQRALVLLEEYRPVCGDELVAADVGYRYAARIADLKAAGFRIESDPCADPMHNHRSRVAAYQLVPDELVLFESVV